LYATPLGGVTNNQGQDFQSNNIPLPHVDHNHTTPSPVSAINSDISSLSYEICQPGNPKSWDGRTNPISLFGQIQEIDVNNVKISLAHISDFISYRELKNNREEDISFLKGFGQVVFDFIAAVFKGGWDHLKTDINNKTFRELIKDEFTTKILFPNKRKKTYFPSPIKPENFSKLPLFQLLSRPSKKVLAKSKFHGKNTSDKSKKSTKSGKPLYTQVSSKNINNILQIKENFPELSNKKIEEVNKTIFSKTDKPQPRINMMTKGPSWKQIIIPISIDNANKFMVNSNKHIANFNCALRSTKSDLSIDFIHVNHQSLIVTSNRVISPLEISIVSNYIKNCNNIDSSNI